MEPAFLLSLFDPQDPQTHRVPVRSPDVASAPDVRPTGRRRAKARAVRDAGWARWIKAGRPIALLVARRDGFVTAETFRVAAEQLRPQRRTSVLPARYGAGRTLSYLSSLFAELVREGYLRKRVRADGSVVKVLSKGQRNDHVVYEPVPGRGA
jgi:hypothetical protein